MALKVQAHFAQKPAKTIACVTSKCDDVIESVIENIAIDKKLHVQYQIENMYLNICASTNAVTLTSQFDATLLTPFHFSP